MLTNKRFSNTLIFVSIAFVLASCVPNGAENNKKGDNGYHTVVWLNYDNSLIYRDTKVAEGETPVYEGETPERPSDQQYTYTFSGWSPDVVPAYTDATYVAQFSNTLNKYSVTWKDDDGRVLSTEEYEYGSVPSYKRNIPNKEKDGYRYTFKSWSPAVESVTGDITYSATYNKTAISYNITYNLNGGTNSSNNPSSYTVESNITFKNASRTGYLFDGWYRGDTKITSISAGSSTGNITLEARWTAIQNTLSVTSQDLSKGTVSIVSGSGYSDETIVIEAAALDGYVFYGWYQGTVLISKQSRFTFTMPTSDYSLSARFLSPEEVEEAEAEEERNRALGITPVIDIANKTVTYGLYPQTNINDIATISALDELTQKETNGWYLYNGEYYAKAVAHPHRESLDPRAFFSNGVEVEDDYTYWFKCEPITWKILSNNSNGYYLLSTLAIDCQKYDDSSMDYSASYIRRWLTSTFYRTAFALDNSFVQITRVNNSASTTNKSDNPYACSNTQDKVFLPSYQDYLNVNYGFSSSTDSSVTRRCKATDWTVANGMRVLEGSCDGYWTRSPHYMNSYNSSKLASTVDGVFGQLLGGRNVKETIGVRPAITLKTSNS